MVIKRCSLIIFLAFFLMINSVFALNTVVTMTTSYPNHNITINVLDALKEDNVLAYLNNATDINGITTFTFDTEGKKDISIHTIVRKNGKIIKEKRFDDLVSGEPVDLELKEEKKSSSSTPVKNQTVQNTTVQNKTQENITEINTANEQKAQNITEQKTNTSLEEDSSKITGAASSASTFKIPSAVYYVVGVIVLVVIILYALRRAKPYFSFTSQIKESSNAVEGGKNLRKSAGIKDKELEAAEKKIREAEEEIRRIKERNNRILDAEKKFQEVQRELDRLKKSI